MVAGRQAVVVEEERERKRASSIRKTESSIDRPALGAVYSIPVESEQASRQVGRQVTFVTANKFGCLTIKQ